jgi:hypothetical protein
LELLPRMEQQVKIGDAIIVAGNSEGEGVVRELPGKITGLGPDRIEVDATMVPGNSGSPIILKSTGQVVGVATYLSIPPWMREGSKSPNYKSPTSLNEIRRFGYRLDTVTTWIKSDPANRLEDQGITLSRIEESAEVLLRIIYSGTAYLVKYGADSYVSKERAELNPGLVPLARAVDDFTTGTRAAKGPSDNQKAFLKLFDSLKASVTNEVKDLKPENFTGFYSRQLKEQLDWRKQIFSWLNTMAAEGAKNAWTITGAPSGWGGLADPSKLSLIISHEVDASQPAERRHRISFGPQYRPNNAENLFWVVETPQRETNVVQLSYNVFRVPTPADGNYRVYVEYRGPGITRKISNIVDFNVGSPVAGIRKGDPASQAFLEKAGLWLGDVRLRPGAYTQTKRVTVGQADPQTSGHVYTTPRTMITASKDGEILVMDGEWRAEGTLFKNGKFRAFLNGQFIGKDSLYENCNMVKWGVKNARLFSSKWSFENCVISKNFIKQWTTVGTGVKIQNCTFYEVNFSPITYRADAGVEARDEWMTVKNCRFVGCSVPESFLIVTQDCIFENCKFGPADEAMVLKTPIKTRIYMNNREEKPMTGTGRTVEVSETTRGTVAGATLPHVRGNNGSLHFQ